MTYNVLMWTLNPTQSLTHSIDHLRLDRLLMGTLNSTH